MKKAEFINELNIPAIAAPMFLISGPKLVLECCKNGIVGTGLVRQNSFLKKIFFQFFELLYLYLYSILLLEKILAHSK